MADTLTTTTENDYVCSRTTMRVRTKGSSLGSLRQAIQSWSGLTMVRVVDGRLVESWVKNDVIGLMKQLAADIPR
jgi:hypothetical protein